MQVDQPLPPTEIEVHGRRYRIEGPTNILIIEDGLLGITPEAPMQITPGSGTHYRVMKELSGAGATFGGTTEEELFADIQEALHDFTAPAPSVWKPSTWAWDTIGWWAMGAGVVGGLGYSAWRYRAEIQGLVARGNPLVRSWDQVEGLQGLREVTTAAPDAPYAVVQAGLEEEWELERAGRGWRPTARIVKGRYEPLTADSLPEALPRIKMPNPPTRTARPKTL
jgi:hypothetical protein